MSLKHVNSHAMVVLSVGLIFVLSGTLSAQSVVQQNSPSTNAGVKFDTFQRSQTATSSTQGIQGIVNETQTTTPSDPSKRVYKVTPTEKKVLYDYRQIFTTRRQQPAFVLGETSIQGTYEIILPQEPQNPKLLELAKADRDFDQKAKQLAQQIREGKPGPEGVHQKLLLSTVVEQHFDVRQKLRSLELKRLEDQLARLREVIKRRNDSRDLIVGKRLSELLGEQYELDF